MKAFQAQIYDEVKIFDGIYLTVYDWEKPDPFIGLGWSKRIYPPPLFSRIENNRLMEVDDSVANLLSDSGRMEANNFSLTEPGEKLLIVWSIGQLFSLVAQSYYETKPKNVILGVGRYPTFSNGDIVTNSCFHHMSILAVLPAEGGAIEASGRFFDKTTHTEHHKMMLKTLQGEVKIELPG